MLFGISLFIANVMSLVQVLETNESDVLLEKDGTPLLSMLQPQCPNAFQINTIRNRQESKLNEEFKIDDVEHIYQEHKSEATSSVLKYHDLIVKGSPLKTTEEDLKSNFSKYGELQLAQIEKNVDGTSRGFGLIRFKEQEPQDRSMFDSHVISGSKCEIKISNIKDQNDNSKSRSITLSRSRSRSPSDYKSRSRSPTRLKIRSRSLSSSPSCNCKNKSPSRHSYFRSRPRYRSCFRDRRRSYRSHSRHSFSKSRSRARLYSGDCRHSNRSHSRHSFSGSRSRARSYSGDRRRSNRSHSRHSFSKSQSRSRLYSGNRRLSYRRTSLRRSRQKNPKPSKCLGIFGLSIYTTQLQLCEIFENYGLIDRIVIIKYPKSGRSRGFAFVYFKKHKDAKLAKEKCSGMEINGRRIRVDFSINHRPRPRTHSKYLGRFIRRSYNRYSGRGYDDGGRHNRERRSPSYHNNRTHYKRSRKRSYSPR